MCCGEHVEQTVDDAYDDWELQTQAHSSWWDILEPAVLKTTMDCHGELYTAASEEQSASAGHHALAVTDHDRTSESQWSDVLQHSEQTTTSVTLFSAEKNRVAVTKAQRSVITDSASSDRRTHLSWRSQNKHVLQMSDTYLSLPRSAAIVAPRTGS